MVIIKHLSRLWRNTKADAVVEATILFPIIIMIFAALVLLSMYLPQRALLQEAVQVAAVTIATERSDTWMFFDDNAAFIARGAQPRQQSVYTRAFNNVFRSAATVDEARAQSIVESITANSILSSPGSIRVESRSGRNYFVFPEVTVTATQTIPVPVNLALVGFPGEIVLTAEARASILDGDEFVRNIDIAADMMRWVNSRLGLSDSLEGALGTINEVLSAIPGLVGR